MEIISTYGPTLILFAAVVGFLMAWGVGANDVANAMGTSVGSKALTIKQAVIIAMVFEFAGAYLAGGEVTATIRKGIIDGDYFTNSPELLVFGMISSLLAAGLWLALASYRGWPVSTTHSIIGGILGFALTSAGIDSVSWGKVGGIFASWIVTPAIAGVIAYLIFMSAQRLIFDKKDPLEAAKRYVPYYMGLAGLVLAMVTIKKGLKHVGLGLDPEVGFLISVMIAIIVFAIGKVAIKRIQFDEQTKGSSNFNNVEKIFAVLMVVTACCMAFAHGSNDVANAIGPLAAVVSIVNSEGQINQSAALDWWILPLGAVGIVLGLALFGQRVIGTIGQGITHLTPSRGFAAELAAASTVVLASGTGLPISTTQTLVGAVMGVGMARGIAALNMSTIRRIILSWMVTLPAGAILSYIFFTIIRSIFTL
ncbi:inorganic phosphate transporter [Alteromonas sp. a30]|uniref:inorganic phosphate transporter n=1 Tax=Alteromonas sp. a30 TaxID=2730917 RepID=UPI00228276C5|nr:inorganic phosphate transporter [Alteromonas sp. a30]MCY7296025.1 phosphate permease [Alteromonas sp. a30]